jgi:hypothetical protein
MADETHYTELAGSGTRVPPVVPIEEHFLHFRVFTKEDPGTPLPCGGVTLCARRLSESHVVIGITVCSPYDNYCKRTGRIRAAARARMKHPPHGTTCVLDWSAYATSPAERVPDSKIFAVAAALARQHYCDVLINKVLLEGLCPQTKQILTSQMACHTTVRLETYVPAKKRRAAAAKAALASPMATAPAEKE